MLEQLGLRPCSSSRLKFQQDEIIVTGFQPKNIRETLSVYTKTSFHHGIIDQVAVFTVWSHDHEGKVNVLMLCKFTFFVFYNSNLCL